MPLVSVLLAVRDGAAYLREAVASVLFQSLQDLELVVVDDASTDATAEVLASFEDPRLTVLRNEEQQGLARSLNLALDRVQGDWVARLDADDVALPLRLETQLQRARADGLAIVGSSILELDAVGSPGRFHPMPRTPHEVRWHGLFSSPFFHPSVLVDRRLLERHELRYDVEYTESEDYDLWMRLLRHAEGANTAEPLVLYRVHERQATKRRREVQRDFQREVALREIAAVLPDFTTEEAEAAWLLGSGEGLGSAEAFEPVSYTHLTLPTN